MASSSRQSALFGVQDWKKIYQTYREADFVSYDYETLRKTFIDYLTTYYPETFNDYIESSEFIALLDVMAYMGQALAFRSDLNARENFIDTAERRDSVIKLANLVSYTPKRNITAQGTLKITAIQTTEDIRDINGTPLANQPIQWNDPANPYWQTQFNSIINSSLISSQYVGRPGNSATLLGIKTDEYTLSIPGGYLPIVPFVAQVDGVDMNFEAVSVTSLNRDYLYEIPPAPSGAFNILYQNDRLGFGSANTGWFVYFKQGVLQNVDFNFPDAVENNVQLVNIEGINNTDTWLYKLDSQGNTEQLWTQVESIYANAQLQLENSLRTIFSVTSRANDQVTYVFGDGVFAEIPVGSFRAYVRSGNALKYTIDPNEIQGITVNIGYLSRTNRIETLTLTLSLQNPINTALTRESLASIKERAPARYYTQNRMVNGEDYTNFPYTLYNSIVKSKALNRSSIGVTRSLDLLDPTGKYSSTNVFANDGALWIVDGDDPTTGAPTSATTFSLSNINFATEFLTQSFKQIISSSQCQQYYLQYYPRYSGYYTPAGVSGSYQVYWNLSTVNSDNVTGYFYISTTADYPQTVGPLNGTDLRYIAQGTLIKFVCPNPDTQCFDKNNRIVTRQPNYIIGDKTYIWVGVEEVIGDGENFGNGNLENGSGPITLSEYVPQTAIIDKTLSSTYTVTAITKATPGIVTTSGTHLLVDGQEVVLTGVVGMTEVNAKTYYAKVTGYSTTTFALYNDPALENPVNTSIYTTYVSGGTVTTTATGIIPSIDTSLSNTIIRQCLNLIQLRQDFALSFDNSITANLERWEVVQPIPTSSVTPTSYFMSFTFNSVDNVYYVRYRTLQYYFGSVSEVRFFFDQFEKVFDNKSGQTIADFVNIQGVNSNLQSAAPLGTDYFLDIIAQPVQSDGYADDYAVEITSIDSDTGYPIDPDFFELITDTTTSPYPYVFFRTVTDSLGLYRQEIVPNGAIVIAQETYADVYANRYLYPAGTTFYTDYDPVSYNIVSISAATPAVVTTLPHNFSDGQRVVITGAGTNNGVKFVKVTGYTSTTFALYSDPSLTTPVTGVSAVSGIVKTVPGWYTTVLNNVTNVVTLSDVTADYSVESGRGAIIFQYRHNSNNTTRIDPGTTNIIDLYVVTQQYYTEYTNWINDTTGVLPEPLVPTINQLTQAYGDVDQYKMLSDSVVLNSVQFKPLFGQKASPALRGTIKIIKSPFTTASDSQIRSATLTALNNYFSLDKWNFGDTFYFSELTAYLHVELGDLINSVVVVPQDPNQKFGDLYEVRCAPYEIFVNGATANDIVIVASLTPTVLQQ
jgi:hypothetical protein